jgi:AraC family transcriptional regulator, alkane utilization regulator
MSSAPKILAETPAPQFPAAGATDVLSDVLRIIHLSGAIFFDADVAAPWAARSASAAELARMLLPRARQLLLFHAIERGRCWIALDHAAPLELESGDIVLLPYADEHTLASDLSLTPIPITQILKPAPGRVTKLVLGKGADRTRIVCGFLQCDELLFNPLCRGLPRQIHLRTSQETAGSLLTSTMRSMIGEVHAGQAGTACVLSRLTELLFIEVLRRLMTRLQPDAVGWLSALNDPIVGRALQLLHARPAHGWTVNELARHTAASRSLLADRFRTRLGQPPMRYLTCWRLQLAAELLCHEGLGLAAIAAEVGYESEGAFNRAFRREVGEPPATWRARNLAPRSGSALQSVRTRAPEQSRQRRNAVELPTPAVDIPSRLAPTRQSALPRG